MRLRVNTIHHHMLTGISTQSASSTKSAVKSQGGCGLRSGAAMVTTTQSGTVAMHKPIWLAPFFRRNTPSAVTISHAAFEQDESKNAPHNLKNPDGNDRGCWSWATAVTVRSTSRLHASAF